MPEPIDRGASVKSRPKPRSQAPLRIHLLYETSNGRDPHGCSHIRLIRPLTHPRIAARFHITQGIALPDDDLDLAIVERLWDTNAPPASREALVAALARRGIPFIYTLDDDLLDLNTEAGLPETPSLAQRHWIRHMCRQAIGLMVSTAPLAERLASLNRCIEVVPNALDERLFERAVRRQSSGHPLTVGYMGTYSHLDNLLSIAAPLRRCLARLDGRVQFEIVGIADPTRIAPLLAGLPVSVRNPPPDSVSYPQFVEWMHRELRWDFAVAPLRDTPFNRCKSDLKLLDYGALGIPCLCSDSPSYRDTAIDGANALLVPADGEAWETALMRMAEDAGLRARLAEGALAYVRSHRLLATQAQRWLEAIEAILDFGQPPPDPELSEPAFLSEAPPSIGPAVAVSPPLSRRDKILYLIDSGGKGLEIGPSFSPILPKAEGFDIETLDHASAADLRGKYASHGVDVSRIEEVDFVWQGESMVELTGKPGAYDFVLASHVIEHTPDLVGFLRECEALLKPGGILSLVAPDRRWCFDCLRPSSTTGEVLQAHLDGCRRHPPGAVFDDIATTAYLNGQPCWFEGAAGQLEPVNDWAAAVAAYEQAKGDSAYIDVHRWQMTPHAMRLILRDLYRLGLTGLVEACQFPTEGCEFFLSLRKGGKPPASDRFELLRHVAHEWMGTS